MESRNLFKRILKIEPGVALGQWAYERAVANWALITAAFSGLGGMSVLAYLTEWVQAYGPVGVGAAGLGSFLVIWLMLSLIQYLKAATAQRYAYANEVTAWRKSADLINPLDNEFHKQRIKFYDLANPISKRIERKRFVDCELYGPAVIVLSGNAAFSHVGLINCDVVVMDDGAKIYNAILMIDVEMYSSKIFSSTIYITKSAVSSFRGMGARFVNEV